MLSNMLRLVLDSLSFPLVVLNQSGIIVYVNSAWKQFADANALAMDNHGVGWNYLNYCKDPKGNFKNFDNTLEHCFINALDGIQGEDSSQSCCHGQINGKWFQIRITRFDYQGSAHATVLHENITFSKLPESLPWDIVENSPIGIAVVTLGGRIIETNQSLCKMLGYEANELLNINFSRFNHPVDADNDAELLQGLLEGKQGYYYIEKRLIKKDGGVVWIGQTCSVTRDASDKPKFIIKQIQDITGKAKAESSFPNREYRLSPALDEMPVLIGYWNKDLINELDKRVFKDWVFIEPSVLNGRSIDDMIGMLLNQGSKLYLERVLSGLPQVLECIVKDASGFDRPVLASYIPDFSENTVRGFFLLLTDISQFRNDKLELTKSQQFSQILLNVSIDGFTFTDLHGKFLYANPAFCQMMGYTQAEMIRMSVSDIEQSENAEQIQARIKKILSVGFDRFETSHRRRDGRLIDVEVSVAYLAHKKQLFAFTRDITQRKQSEKLQIQQLELQHDAFVREVHHRIKNHLQGIQGLLSLCSMNSLHERELLKDISAKISSIAVVYGLQSQDQPGVACLCEIVREICNSVKLFDMDNSTIACSIRDDRKALLHPEYAVPIALILNELLINALKHNSKSNNKEVCVELYFTEGSVVLTVTNSSRFQAGFPDFEAGIRLGIGLSLVRTMLPKIGADFTLTQQQGSVCAQISLMPPVITLLSGC